ncbi:Uncharacterized protein APZ42_023028 [Daphnia magna]|uniref:Uncharacterized protein n=1 Tax=Daphnia magna TaxID=35525 RepID=A0A164VA12_9CRUS|nr:Uncharacterized protein APZ42_023028 [Daphnia magna]
MWRILRTELVIGFNMISPAGLCVRHGVMPRFIIMSTPGSITESTPKPSSAFSTDTERTTFVGSLEQIGVIQEKLCMSTYDQSSLLITFSANALTFTLAQRRSPGKQGGEGMSSVNEKKKMYKIPNPTKTKTEVYSCGTCKYMMASGGVIAVSRLIGCYVFFVVFLGRHYILKIG